MATSTSKGILKPSRPTTAQTQETDTLVRKLLAFGEADAKTRKLVRSHVYNIPVDVEEGGDGEGKGKEVEVRSWNLNEFAYKREPCPFPTRARGLFTALREGVEEEGRYRIVARGYDKFFNVGEVGWTRWDKLPEYTKGPYYLTLKTNGCIIFVSALSPSTLLITSKHAIGDRKSAISNAAQNGSSEDPDINDAEAGEDSEPDDHATEDVVTSSDDARRSTFDKLTHAGVGSYWLSRHLSSLPPPRNTRSALAKELWDANATAVAELTDDAFEEHVLPTPCSQVGLNLHGLNRNVGGRLETFTPERVEEFARRWGMHPTPWRSVGTVEEVRRVCEEVEREGWEGTMVEGVVVRASPAEERGGGEEGEREEGVVKGAKFWKVKFDEPYLMYREWRELTRRLVTDRRKLLKDFLSLHPHSSSSSPEAVAFLEKELKEKVNPSRLRNPQSRGYAAWLIRTLPKRGEGWHKEWAKGRGIVETREEYLRWRESGEGKVEEARERVEGLEVDGKKEDKVFDRTLVVPIAAPGCGKTVLGLALTAFLGIQHTQSDDVTAKKTAAGFVRNVRDLLLRGSTPATSATAGEVDEGPGATIVFADKNNHLRTHREAMVEVAKELEKGVNMVSKKKEKGGEGGIVVLRTRLVALVWDVAEMPQDEFHRLAAARIVARGENHQSLRPERTAEGVEAHEFILWRFLKDLEPFDPALCPADARFDEVVELKVVDEPKVSLKKVVERLRKWVEGVPEPTDAALDAALEKVKEYKVGTRKEMTLDAKASASGPRYYAVAIPVDLRGLVDSSLAVHPNVDRTLFDVLVKKKRFTAVPHMTLLHSNEVARPPPDPEGVRSETEVKKEKEELWKHYRDVAGRSKAGEATIDVTIGPRLVWDGRVMAAEVSYVGPEEAVRWTTRKGRAAHVTVGTIGDEVKPVEGKYLLQKVLDAEAEGTDLNVSVEVNGSGGGGGGGDRAVAVQVLEIPLVQVKGVIKGLF